MKNIHKNIYAKSTIKDGNNVPGMSVFAHSLIVGIVCQEIIKILPKEIVEKYNLINYPFIVSLHDIGKASPGFQEQILLGCGMSNFKSFDEIKKHYVTKHEQISTEYLKNEYPEIFEVPECILSFIRWHHGTYRNEYSELDDYNIKKYGDGNWKNIRNDLFNELKNFFGYSKEFFDLWRSFKKGNFHNCILDPDVKYMMGLLSVCDWVGSDPGIFDSKDYLENELDVEKIRSIAQKALKEYGFERVNITKNLTFDEIFSGYTPNNIQKTLGEIANESGIYVVEAPMGSGKTEAAEYAAYKCLEKGIVDGIYFALPTQTTSNSIFERYKTFVNRISDIKESDIRLAHSKSIFQQSDSGMSSWFSGKRSIISPFAVGTIDQALMSVLGSIKHFYLRSFGLSRKCVILDEVHSYDTYTSELNVELINNLLELNCVIILLSATLTKESRRKLCGDDSSIDKYPLITKVVGDVVSHYNFKTESPNKTITINTMNVENNLNSKDSKFISSRQSALEDVLIRAKNGQMVLWIENTVKESQEIYFWFKNHKIDCGLINSKFTNKDREENEKKWISRYGKNSIRTGSVLVSTQVCEQSVDIDSDYLVTAICPSDMLFQRIGRLQRHDIKDRKINPECLILTSDLFDSFNFEQQNSKFIFKKSLGPVANIYQPYYLRKTHILWKSLNKISIPKDIRNILEMTYDDNDDGIGLMLKKDVEYKTSKDYGSAITAINRTYGNQKDDDSVNIDDVDIKDYTRLIDNPTVEVILISDEYDDKFKSIYNQNFYISKKMHHDNLKIINDSSIRIYESFVKSNQDLFKKIEIGKREYILCKVKSGSLYNYSDKSLSKHSYTSEAGFF